MSFCLYCELEKYIYNYFTDSDQSLDQIENILIKHYDQINNQDKCKFRYYYAVNDCRPINIIFKHVTNKKFIDVLKLFIKYGANPNFMSNLCIESLIKVDHDLLLEIILVTICSKIYNRLIDLIINPHTTKKIYHDSDLRVLLSKILKYLLLDIGSQIDQIEYIRIVCIFIVKYDDFDTIDIFKNILQNKHLQILPPLESQRIFHHTLNSTSEHSDHLLQILLDNCNQLPSMVDAVTTSIMSKNKINKLNILLSHLNNINQTLFDKDIIDILYNIFTRTADETLNILLDINFYPKDLTLLDKKNNIRFSIFVSTYVKNIKLTEENELLREQLFCHPGGAYAVELKNHFESLA